MNSIDELVDSLVGDYWEQVCSIRGFTAPEDDHEVLRYRAVPISQVRTDLLKSARLAEVRISRQLFADVPKLDLWKLPDVSASTMVSFGALDPSKRVMVRTTTSSGAVSSRDAFLAAYDGAVEATSIAGVMALVDGRGRYGYGLDCEHSKPCDPDSVTLKLNFDRKDKINVLVLGHGLYSSNFVWTVVINDKVVTNRDVGGKVIRWPEPIEQLVAVDSVPLLLIGAV